MPTRHGILASFARAGASQSCGFPTDCEIGDLDRLYWGLCTHVGTGVTQNCEAGLMHYVTDGECARRTAHGSCARATISRHIAVVRMAYGKCSDCQRRVSGPLGVKTPSTTFTTLRQ